LELEGLSVSAEPSLRSPPRIASMVSRTALAVTAAGLASPTMACAGSAVDAVSLSEPPLQANSPVPAASIKIMGLM